MYSSFFFFNRTLYLLYFVYLSYRGFLHTNQLLGRKQMTKN